MLALMALPVRAAVPGVPGDVSLAVAYDAITVTWTAPTGDDPTSYSVRYKKTEDPDTAWTTQMVSLTPLSYTITGLTPWVSYDVQVRASNADGDSAWSASESLTVRRDIDLGPVSDTGGGLWSDGVTLWVAGEKNNSGSRPIYAYTLATGLRDTTREFSIDVPASETGTPGICSDGVTWWVGNGLGLLRAHVFPGGARDASKDIDVGFTVSAGVWCDQARLLNLDRTAKVAKAFTLPGRMRDPSGDIRVRPASSSIFFWGVWSDGETVWVSNTQDNAVEGLGFDGWRRVGLDVGELDDRQNHSPRGIWSDGTTVWVTDSTDRYVYSYRLPQAEDGGPEAWSATLSDDGETVTITFDEPLDTAVTPATARFAVTVDSESAALISVAHTTGDIRSITLTLSDPAPQGKAVTIGYTDPTGDDTTGVIQDVDDVDLPSFTGLMTAARPITEDVTLISNQDQPAHPDDGFVRMGTVTDQLGQVFTTGSRPGGYQLKSVSFELESFPLDRYPTVTIHTHMFGDVPGALLYTLTPPATVRDGVTRFAAPEGAVLSRATTYMVVIDSVGASRKKDALYTGRFGEDSPGATGWSIADSRRTTQLGTWQGIGPPFRITITGTGHDAPIKAGQPTGVMATAGDRQIAVSWTAPTGDPDPTGYAVRYRLDTETAWATATRSDDTALTETLTGLHNMRTYDVQVTSLSAYYGHDWTTSVQGTTTGAAATDATLSAATLSGVMLGTAFAPDTLTYTGDAPVNTDTTTIAVTPTDARATYEFLDGSDASLADADDGTEGHQAGLPFGEATIKVRVTAEDRSTTQTYTFTVTRALPEVSVSIEPETAGGPLAEGFDIAIAVTLSDGVLAGADFPVRVTVAEAGGNILTGEGTITVTIPPGASRGATPLTATEDTAYEAHTMVTATIVANADAYTIATGGGTASATVLDNDFPTGTYTLTVGPLALDEPEGGTATVTATVTVTTSMDEEPHGGPGTLRVTTTDMTATSSGANPDYTALTDTTGAALFDEASDFTRVDIDDDPVTEDWRYRHSKTVAIEVLDDALREQAETFRVGLEPVSGGDDPTSPHVSLTGASTQTVTINTNDRSDNANLASLRLNTGTLMPDFSAGETSYRATVPFGTTAIRISATRADTNATLQYFDDGTKFGADNAASILRPLAIGENVFTIEVTPDSGDTTLKRTYTVTVTRSVPELTITAPSDSTESDAIGMVFLVRRNGRVPERTAVMVSLTESSDLIMTSGSHQIGIAAGSVGGAFTALANSNNDRWQEHSLVTVTLLESDDYTAVGTNPVTAMRLDDDFPDADATLRLSTDSVSENDEGDADAGDSLTATVRVRTKRAELPHEGGGRIRLTIGADHDDDTADASSADYTVTGSTTLSFPRDEFVRVDADGNAAADGDHYQLEKSITIKIRNDTIKEQPEVFRVTMSRVTSGVRTDSRITLASDNTRDVTIALSDLSTDAALRGISLATGGVNRATFEPTFTPGRGQYSPTVPFQYPQVTVIPTVNESNATYVVETLSGTALDDNDDMSGVQVDLSLAGFTTVRIVVTAEDGRTMRTYTLAINRLAPVVSIAMPSTDLDEGDDVVATVSRIGATDDETVVSLNITDSSGSVADTSTIGSRMATIAAGDTSVDVTVTTTDDDDWDAHATISFGLVDVGPNDYTIAGDATVSRSVLDDDFPDSTAGVTVVNNTVSERSTVTLTVTVETDSDHEPHADGGTLLLSTSDGPDATDVSQGVDQGGSATSGSDYVALSNRALNFVAGDFTRDATTMTWKASKEVPITISDDTTPEFLEGLTVTLSKRTATPNPADGNIELDSAATSQYLVISRNDLSNDPGLKSAGLSTGILMTGGAVTTIDPTVTDYTVSVAFEFTSITLTPEPQTTGATLLFLDSSDMKLTDNTSTVTVNLPVNTPTVVKIRVTAQDESQSRDYTLTITRREPVVSISNVSTAEVVEGTELTFTVSLSGPAVAAAGRDVAIKVSEAGVISAFGGSVVHVDSLDQTVNVPMGQTSATLTVVTVDDEGWDEHTDVTASVEPGTGYTVNTDPAMAAATRRVNDNDFPAAVVTLSAPSTVTEPASTVDGRETSPSAASVQVTITTNRNEEPHEGAGHIRLTTTDGTALAASDYTALTASAGLPGFPRSAFQAVDHDSDPNTPDRYQARQTVPIAITHDNIEEPDENFTVSMALVPAGEPSESDSQLRLGGATSSSITIEANDEHRVDRLDVSPTTDSANVTVTVANPSNSDHTVYLRYRQSALSFFLWNDQKDTSGQMVLFEANFDIFSVGPGRTIVMQGSLDDTFPADKTVQVEFTTLGDDPIVSEVVARSVTQTGSQAEVRLANLDAGVEEIVRLRFRVRGASDWSTPEPATQTTLLSSVTFDLPDLASDTEYEVEATIEDDFDSGSVQRVSFTTDPPAITEVSVADASVTDNEATVTVTVTGPNGARVFLRFRTGSDDWTPLADGSAVDADESGATFELEGLIPGTRYDVQASYDITFPAGVTQSATFTTTGERPSDAPPPGGGGGGIGGIGIGIGGGGGGPSGPQASDIEFEWNVERDIDELDSGNEWPTGMWSDGATLWLLDNPDGTGDAVYAYSLESGERAEDRDFELDETNRAPRGVWSDRTTIWISDSGPDRLFAHDIATGERTPERDIELDDRNADPRGIWSDGETMWVLDNRRNALFAYDLGSGELLGECALADANDGPHGIWSDRTTIWVSNHDPKQLFAYRLLTREELDAAPGDKALERVPDEEFTTPGRVSNNSPRGIWSDGDVMYVADENDGRVYSYNMPDAIDARLASLSLEGVDIGEFDGDLTEYEGVPGDGVTQTTVAAEPAQSGIRVAIEPADADDDARGHQVELGGVEEIVVAVTSADGSRERLYRVSLPTPSEDDFAWNGERDIEQLDPENDRPTSLWSDGATLWVLEDGEGSGGAVYAYDLESGERLEEHEFALDETNRAPRGVWSDRVTVWVSDSDHGRLYAYDPGTGERAPERDIEIDDRNGDPRGIWSDGETMWVLDGGQDALFAYDLATGELVAQFELDGANGDPRGIWSDGVTVWVSDHITTRVFAYRLPAPEPQVGTVTASQAGSQPPRALERVPDEEFRELSGAGNNSPRGIWSDGDVMYVVDQSDGRVYTYNMPDAIDARLRSLSLEGVDIGEFSSARTEYEGVPGDGVTQTTVAAEPVQSGGSVDIWPANADEEADGHQVALNSVEAITVTVTSPDGSRSRVYRVSLPAPSEDDFAWNGGRDIEQLDPENDRPTGLWSDGATLWVIEDGEGPGGAVYAYDLETGERLEEHELALDETNRAPRGVWSDSVTVWVSDSDQGRLYAYDPGPGERTPERDIELDDRNGDPRGIWSDGEAMWVLDGDTDGVFAYDLASGALLGEYTLAGADSEPRGIWSDRTTIWVSNHDPKRLFAYRLPTRGEVDAAPGDKALERVQGEDFTELSKANNNSPRGIWSDGQVMYVADENDGRVYSYNMPDAIDARLVALELSRVEFGEFSPLRHDYAAETIPDGNIATLTAIAARDGASVEIEPADHDGDPGNGYHVRLLPGLEIAVTVTSADGSRERVYRLLLGGEEAGGPAPDCLRGAVATGFSLVFYEGGSIEELEACAESRHVTTLYALEGGAWVPYITGAPGFVNRAFVELFPGGVPPGTALVARSAGPPSEDPSPAPLAEASEECLRGEVVRGFSIVVFRGGSVQELDGCARALGVTTLYALDRGSWVPYIIGAPGFVNRSFVALYAGGMGPGTPLVAKSDGQPAAGPEGGGG